MKNINDYSTIYNYTKIWEEMVEISIRTLKILYEKSNIYE